MFTFIFVIIFLLILIVIAFVLFTETNGNSIWIIVLCVLGIYLMITENTIESSDQLEVPKSELIVRQFDDKVIIILYGDEEFKYYKNYEFKAILSGEYQLLETKNYNMLSQYIDSDYELKFN